MAPMEIDILDPRFYDDPWDGYRWLRDQRPGALGRRATSCGSSPATRTSATSAATRSCTRRPRACGPRWRRRCRSSRWTTPSTPASAASSTRASRRPQVRQLADHIRELSNQIIDEIAERGRVRLRRGLRHPRAAHRHRRADGPRPRPAPDSLYRWSDAMMAGDGHIDPDDPVLHAAAEAFGEYVADVRRADRGAPRGRHDRRPHRHPHPRLRRGRRSPRAAMAPISRRGRRADRRRAVHVPHPARRGRQRDHPQRPHRRAAGLLAVPRPEAASCSTDPELIDPAVDEIVRYVSPVMSLHAARSPRPTSYQGADLEGGRQGPHALPVGQPRRGRVRRPRRVPRRPRPEPAPRLRHRHPLLPRRQPGPGRGRGRVHRAVRPAPRHPGRPTAPSSSGATPRSCSPLQHLPAVFTPERVMAAAAP